MKLERKIIKIGGGKYISIPPSIVKALGKKEGDILVIEIKEEEQKNE